jgi:TRAP-type transport system periplasmic protein
MMTMVTRRASMLGSGAVLATIAGINRASAAEFSYKYANDYPVDHPMNIRMTQATNRIREATGGKLDIQIFPNNQLGSDTDVLTQVRSGAIEFFTLSGLILSAVVPVAAISGIGFAFPNYPKVWEAIDGDLGGYIRAAIAKTEVIAMEKCWDSGFRQISSSTRPILTPADLEGFKIRVPISPLWTSLFKAFGASPISINSSEMYSALQTKIAEGTDQPLTGIWSLKIYEVQKHISLTGHMWDGFWFLANKRAWETLPADMRAIAAKHINEAAVDQRRDVEKLEATQRTDLEAKGMAFHDVDKEAFRGKLRSAGFFAEWKKRFGDESWAMLEKYTGSIS